MFGRLQELGCHFVLRLRDEAVVQVLEENLVSQEDRQAGIPSDQWVQLDSRKRYQTARLRLITLRKPSGTVMRLVSNIGARNSFRVDLNAPGILEHQIVACVDTTRMPRVGGHRPPLQSRFCYQSLAFS
jgi:hypothetical protein